MLKYTDLQTEGAYIVLVRSHGALARIIQFGMWLWQLFIIKQYPQKTYNHADIVVDGWVIGAIGRGVTTRSINEAYGDGKYRELKVFHLVSYVEGLVAIRAYLQEHAGKPYEYKNFWHHTMRIFKGQWSGKTGKEAQSEFYCIELAAGVFEVIYPTKISAAWQINPVEFHMLCKDYLTELKPL